MKINDEEIFFIDFEDDIDKSIVYVPLRSYLSLINIDLKKIIIENNSEISNAFFSMIKKKEYVDPILLHERNKMILPQLSIPITDNCNLKCEYCYFRAGDDDRKKTMSKDLIKACVDAYVDNIQQYSIQSKGKYIDVSIAGGGEPTVEFELFKFAVLYIEKKLLDLGITPRFTMPTNGAYGDKVREFIVQHFYQLSFSMDGPEYIQNFHRPCKNGNGSYKQVFESAKYFYNSNIKMAFRITVTNYSVKHLLEVLDFFDREFKGINVGIEAMNAFGRAINNPKVSAPDPIEYSDALLVAHRYAAEKGMKIKNASTGKFECLRTVFCGAVGIPNWTVTTDGRVTSCTRDNMPDDFSFGRFNETTKKFEIEQEKVERLRNMSVFAFPECEDCFCKYNCAGDCPDLRLANMLNCNATKKIGAFILNKKIKEGGIVNGNKCN